MTIDPLNLHTILVTDEAATIIRQSATKEYTPSGVRLPSGDWSIPVDSEVYEFLQTNKLPGETVSDTIIRYARLATGAKAN